jgi:hypothetical protein
MVSRVMILYVEYPKIFLNDMKANAAIAVPLRRREIYRGEGWMDERRTYRTICYDY